MTRTAVPSEAERKRAVLDALPHASLRIQIRDPFGILKDPCGIRLEVLMQDDRTASGKRIVDANGECWFELVPAGRCELTFVRDMIVGDAGQEVFQKSFTLSANEQASQVLDLGDELVEVELQCVNPPMGGLQQVELRDTYGEVLAEWDCDDPGAGAVPGPLRAWASVGAKLEASFTTLDDEYTERRQFFEPGRSLWRLELPTGELHVRWPPSGGLDKFTLEPSPFTERTRQLSTCFAEAGRGSFFLVPPGRYVLRAGVVVRGDFIVRARDMVDIGTEPVEVSLALTPSGYLRFAMPTAPPGARVDSPGLNLGFKVQASLYPAGSRWPLIGTWRGSEQSEPQFKDVLAGDYDLVLSKGSWSSNTHVTIVPGVETFAQAREWRRLTHLTISLNVPDGMKEPTEVELAFSDGSIDRLHSEGEDISGGRIAVRYETWAIPGPARLRVTRRDGVRCDFNLVVSDAEQATCSFDLPER